MAITYFKIGNTDFSQYVNELKINTQAVYSSDTNAIGSMIVDYKGKRREIEVGIIALNEIDANKILYAVSNLVVSISFRNPHTMALETVTCLIPSYDVEYYTIQVGLHLCKAFKLKFTELAVNGGSVA